MRKSLRKKRQYGTLKRGLQQTQKLQHDARGPWQSRNQEWRQWFLSSISINNNWRLSLSTTLWLTSILGSSQLFWGALFWSCQMQVWFISLFVGLCSVCVLSLDSELNRLRKIHRSPPTATEGVHQTFIHLCLSTCTCTLSVFAASVTIIKKKKCFQHKKCFSLESKDKHKISLKTFRFSLISLLLAPSPGPRFCAVLTVNCDQTADAEI